MALVNGTATICYGKENKITLLKEMRFPHLIGLLYSSFTYFLGFRVNSGEYKLMGLAPYGSPEDKQTKYFIKLIKEELVNIKDDGSIWLNQKYFNYAVGLSMVNESKWEKLFGFSCNKPDGKIEQKHCNLAFAIQYVTEEIVIKMAIQAKKITGSDYLCMAGGVALNCVANGKLIKQNIFKEIFIQPAAGDARAREQAAALFCHYMYYDKQRKIQSHRDALEGCLLGPYFSDKEIEISLMKLKANYKYEPSYEVLCSQISSILDQGNIVGWFQGKMEFGPELANRSILADPRNKEMQKKLNLKIKYRESFRPFAPSVLIEDKNEF